MNVINEKMKKLQPYHPGIDNSRIHLDANESFLSLPQEIAEKVRRAVGEVAFNRYPDPLATDVCRAYADFCGVGADYLTAGNGSDELISVIFGLFLEKGDPVLILEPDFSMYRFYCAENECAPVVLQKDEKFRFSAEEIIRAAEENGVRLIIFSNPCNPTGQGLSAQDVLKIVGGVSCLVVVDEAYMDFWDQPVLRYAPEKENLIVLKTCSKAAGLASIRLGFAAANSQLTGYLRAAKSPYNVNALTQAAGRAVLQETGYLKQALAAIKQSRDRLYAGCLRLQRPGVFNIYETHTNFVLASSCKATILHSRLKDRGISIRLLGGGLLRITAGSESENEKLLSALQQELADL